MIIKYLSKILGLLDRLFIVPFVNFDTYFKIHEKLGFPVKKLRFLLHNGYKLNLENPMRFNEKTAYRHLYDKNPLLQTIVDKYAVREYVKEKIGEKYLIPIIDIYNSEEEIDFDKLPKNYILKSTHGSGQNIIYKDGKSDYSVSEIKGFIKKWRVEKYRFQSLISFVQQIKRRIIIEELLVDSSNKIPNDYKCFVFDGKVEFIQVDNDRLDNHSRNFYDTKWNQLKVTKSLKNGSFDEKPVMLTKMIELAEILSCDFTFMRVDFFTLEDKIYFGELTPAPGGGISPFSPFRYEIEYGKLWTDK